MTRQQQDGPQGIDFTFWLKGETAFSVTIPAQEAVFFVFDRDCPQVRQLLQSL